MENKHMIKNIFIFLFFIFVILGVFSGIIGLSLTAIVFGLGLISFTIKNVILISALVFIVIIIKQFT